MIHLFQDSELLGLHENRDEIKNILAVLIIKTVLADGESTKKEQTKVLEFFRAEFNLSSEETVSLLNTTSYDDKEYTKALTRLEEILNEDDSIKLKIMNHINNIIICDGCADEEYEVFETIKIYLAA